MKVHPPRGLSGIILAGGESRRMGQDKAFLQVGGQPLVQRVLQAVTAVADDVTIVTNSPERYVEYPVNIVRDVYPGTGTLGGIYTGLLVAGHRCALTVACDMPFLNVDLLRYMASLVEQHDVVMPHVGGGQPSPEAQATARSRDLHPLHAIYCKRCLEPMERAIGRGDLRAVAFLPEVRVRFVGRPEIERFDPHYRSLFNANTPEDLRYARELIQAGEVSA